MQKDREICALICRSSGIKAKDIAVISRGCDPSDPFSHLNTLPLFAKSTAMHYSSDNNRHTAGGAVAGKRSGESVYTFLRSKSSRIPFRLKSFRRSCETRGSRRKHFHRDRCRFSQTDIRTRRRQGAFPRSIPADCYRPS